MSRISVYIADQEVGCDVEQMDALERNLAEFVMTKQEFQMIYENEVEDRQREMFFRLWTLKESYMKAAGHGILLEPGKSGMVFEKEGIRAAHSVDERKFMMP